MQGWHAWRGMFLGCHFKIESGRIVLKLKVQMMDQLTY